MTLRERGEAGGRFSTGIHDLDLILGGGIPLYATVVIAGPPGAGKTILAQQMMFANASDKRRALYLTTLSESPLKATRYQSAFTYFDASKFGRSVIYMDIGDTIRKQGLGTTVEVIGDALREQQPYVVVIDSFKAIRDLASSPAEMRTFVYDLAIELAAVQTTSFLVGEYTERDIEEQPEFAIADGIIYLNQVPGPTGQMRSLRVVKMRGVDHSTAAHSFVIQENGINLFALSAISRPTIGVVLNEFVKTGLPEFDELLRGGIPSGSQLLVSGEAGTGKTTLLLQYLWNGLERYNDNCVHFTYEEPPEQIIGNAASFGWDLRHYIDRGKLRIHYTSLPDINPSEQIQVIERLVGEIGAKRAAIDSLTMLLGGIDSLDSIRQHVFQLATILRNAGCTAMITSDPPVGTNRISRFGVEESIIDGVVVLRIREEQAARRRTIEVFKMRGVNHATGEHLMKITGEGIRVFPRVQEAVR